MNSETSGPLPTIAGEVIWRQLDDNAVIVSPQSGEVRVLNGIGTVIWHMLSRQHSVADIVTHLSTQYQVTKTQAEQDVYLFLEELQNRNLIEWQEHNV